MWWCLYERVVSFIHVTILRVVRDGAAERFIVPCKQWHWENSEEQACNLVSWYKYRTVDIFTSTVSLFGIVEIYGIWQMCVGLISLKILCRRICDNRYVLFCSLNARSARGGIRQTIWLVTDRNTGILVKNYVSAYPMDQGPTMLPDCNCVSLVF